MEGRPFGATTSRAGTTDTAFQFCALVGVYTEASGLFNMRARLYNARLARFINADPSAFDGGLNWHAYCENNPITLIDPFGLNDTRSGINAEPIVMAVVKVGRTASDIAWDLWYAAMTTKKALGLALEEEVHKAVENVSKTNAAIGSLAAFVDLSHEKELFKRVKIVAPAIKATTKAKGWKFVGPGGVAAGMVTDYYEYKTGHISGFHYGFNTTVGIIGLTGPEAGLVSAGYSLVDTYYPGGWIDLDGPNHGLLYDWGNAQQQGGAVAPPWFH